MESCCTFAGDLLHRRCCPHQRPLNVEPKFVRSIEGILPSTRAESEEAACAVWHPSGTYFVLPSKAHELVIISAQNDSTAWTRAGSFFASSAGSCLHPAGASLPLLSPPMVATLLQPQLTAKSPCGRQRHVKPSNRDAPSSGQRHQLASHKRRSCLDR